MKPVLVIIAILCSFAAGSYFVQDVRTATVEKRDGLFIYLECKPSDNYEVIGIATEPAVTLTKQTYSQRIAHFIKDAKKTPGAEGIVYNPDASGHYKAFIIKFK